MQNVLNKENFKDFLSKLVDIKLIISLIQEILYLLFNLLYGNKPLFMV